MADPPDQPKPGQEPPLSQRATVHKAHEPAPPHPADLAESFPHLEILELLGQGGMGYVYKARQKGLDRVVALKLLPREVSEDRSFAERFAREARALARLSHPSIVMIHDSGQVGDLYYFVMEFVDGLNLRELLNRNDGRVEPDQALDIVASVCDALEYAHEEGIVHRDIKPENILLDRKGRVKIADFGLAKLLGGESEERRSHLTLSSPNQLLGTLHYMAPEQSEHPTEVDHRADIYSVGVVFYEMLTGELPIGRFPLPSEMGRGTAAVDEVVVRALAKNPEQRFQRASEIKTAVRSATTHPGTGSGPATPVEPVGTQESPAPALDRAMSAAGVAASSLGMELPEVDLWRAGDRMRWPANLLIINSIGFLISMNPLGILTWIAAAKMKRLESRGLAIAGAVCALLPLSVCMIPFGVIGGIWALWELTRPEVAAAFDVVAVARTTARGK